MKDPILRWLLKAMMVLFVVEVALSFTLQVLRSVSTLDLIMAGAVVSVVAYFIREHRSPRKPRPRSTSAGERTPMMPRTKL